MTQGAGAWVRLNGELLTAQQAGQAAGASYTFTDPAVEWGRHYFYLLYCGCHENRSSFRQSARETNSGFHAEQSIEVVTSPGATSRQELGLVAAGQRVLLPLVAR